MAYRNKDDTIKEAQRLGINIDGMNWREMQHAVSAALSEEKYQNKVNNMHTDIGQAYATPAPKKKEGVYINGDTEDIYNEKGELVSHTELAKRHLPTRISLGIPPESKRNLTYDEPLDEDLEYEEKNFFDFPVGSIPESEFRNTQNPYKDATYKIKSKTGKRVVAESMMPKEQAEIMMREQDPVPFVTFNTGSNIRSGYLFKHHRLPCFKGLLLEAGYWQEYAEQLSREPNIYYLTGLLCIEPTVMFRVMREIEMKERRKKDGYE